MIVQFDVEILRAQDIAILRGALFRLADLIHLQGAIDFTRQTTTQRNQAGGMCRQ